SAPSSVRAMRTSTVWGARRRHPTQVRTGPSLAVVVLVRPGAGVLGLLGLALGLVGDRWRLCVSGLVRTALRLVRLVGGTVLSGVTGLVGRGLGLVGLAGPVGRGLGPIGCGLGVDAPLGVDGAVLDGLG